MVVKRKQETVVSFYCHIDLDLNNHVMVVIDEQDNKIVNKHIDKDLHSTIALLCPKMRVECCGCRACF